MSSKIILLVLIASVVGDKCYWNDHCVHQLFSTVTPYDVIRGDLRDLDKFDNCEAVSLWSLHRHGNRNPGDSVTQKMKVVVQLKDQIIESYENGRGHLCAQEIELFRKWTWNETIEDTPSYLTGLGYEELYDIGKRIRQAYPELLTGTAENYYLRSTNEQRTITSGIAFIHGLTDGTNLSVSADGVREKDDVIRPYVNCGRYQQDVSDGPAVAREIDAFQNTPEYRKIQSAVQKRLDINHQLTAEEVYSIYEICRFYRSWAPDRKSPWCAVFTAEDLIVLEYRDDIRHYYRNGYASWINGRLGTLPLKDLYDTLQAATNGSSRKITSYFTHDTMMEMVYCALGLYKDEKTLLGHDIQFDRLWRSSYMSSTASNLMFVLNRCQESGTQVYRVQIFNNEKVTDICPFSGCTWSEFQRKFEHFTNATLDFCSLDYPESSEQSLEIVDDNVTDNATAVKGTLWLLLLQFVLSFS